MQFKDLSPNTADESSGEGVFAEIKNDQIPRLVVTFNNIKCFANRCDQKLVFQAILFLDGSGIIELNFPSVDNAVYYVPVVGLSPGYQPSNFEEVRQTRHLLFTTAFRFLLPVLPRGGGPSAGRLHF